MNSHLLPVKLWVLYFPPWCCHSAQGILFKPGRNPQVREEPASDF
jgi:hypothetical protein